MYKQLVDFTSRILKVDAGYFFRNGFWVSFRYAFVSIIGLATTIVFTRMAPKEVYGAYQYILSFVAFFSFLSLPGMNIAALKSVVNGNDSAVFQAIKWSFLSGLLGIPCIIGYRLYYQGTQEIPAILFIIIALAFAPYYALNTWYVFYEGRQDFFSVAWRALFAVVVNFLALWIALLFDASLTMLIAVYFATGIITSAVFCFEIWLKTKKKLPSVPPLSEDKLDARYGLAATAQKLIFNASETLPLMTIGSVYGFAEVAIFQVAFFVYSSISGYIGALIAMYLPRLFSGTRLERGKMITHNLLSGLLIAGGMALFLVVLFPFLFGDGYRESVRIAWYLLPIVVLLPLKSYLTSYFTANHRITLLIVTYLVGNVLAGIIFYLVRAEGAGIAGSLYVATLVLITTILLLLSYFPDAASRKTASI
ncbi:MAG: oligosaccharide flippase family protein [Candidatus Moraniibacteriota bacterium]|nr:MAG: oligosaccharide flippase family protein [Candidatus Moranbacteria bacterium]